MGTSWNVLSRVASCSDLGFSGPLGLMLENTLQGENIGSRKSIDFFLKEAIAAQEV